MKHLLILQLAIVNLVGAAGIVAAWPYVVMVFKADTSRISFAIVALFLFGLVSCFIRAVKVSQMLDKAKLKLEPEDLLLFRYKSRKAGAKNDHLSKIATWLAMLGMFGTVVGLITMALSLKGNLGGAENLSAAISQAFEGYGVALATTAVGIVAGGWIEVNALFIDTATKCAEVDLAE
jgi:hypothetical protein